MNKKRIITFVLLALLSILAYYQDQKQQPAQQAHQLIADAYAQQRSDIQVTGKGKVVKLLPDDTKGSKHQKMIVRIPTGQTVLIAHNIDLAPRAKVEEGEEISFYGEYEWNRKGGVIHWTHHDPRGKHPDGWLEVNGKKYQ